MKIIICTALAATMLMTTTVSAEPWWLSKYRMTFDNELRIVGNVTLTFASDDGIKDKYRRDYIQSIITKMYYLEYIKANNARIPREQIIKQLSGITPDTIEFMMKKMLENTNSMSNEVSYAIACLYNAIDGIDIDVDVDIARDFGYNGCY